MGKGLGTCRVPVDKSAQMFLTLSVPKVIARVWLQCRIRLTIRSSMIVSVRVMGGATQRCSYRVASTPP